MKFSPKMIAAATAVTVVAGVGLVGTAQASATPAAPASTIQQTAPAPEDGRQLFAGLLFTQGPVADSLIKAGLFQGTPATLKTNRTAEAVAEVSALADAIEAANPGFFAQLSSDLRSGNPQRVQDGLADAAAALEGHVDVIVDEGHGNATCIVVMAVVVVNVVLAGNYAAAFNAEYAYDVQHFWGDVPILPMEDSIAQLAALLQTL